MNNKEVQNIGVVGYCWSGSGAVVDLLKEFEGNWETGEEMLFLKCHHGIMELENVLFNSWDPLNVDVAVKDFMELIRLLNKNEGKFTPGLNFDKRFSGKFLSSINEYINDLTDYRYQGYWWMCRFDMPYIVWLMRKIMNKVVPQDYSKEMVYMKPTREEFYAATKKLMNNLIADRVKAGDCLNVIYDQAVQAQKPEKMFDYFENSKVIVVDRDPRDIYCEMVDLKRIVGRDIADTHDAMKFVKWHKDYRERGHVDDDRVLYLRFEDLIIHYEDTLKTIIDFVGLDSSKHIDKFKYLNPEVSIKNIGKYKNYKYQDEIKILERELLEYLHI